MYAFWGCKDIGNFGDMVTPYILEKLGQKVEFSWMRGIAMEVQYRDWETDRKSTRLNSSHSAKSRMPSSA